MKACSDQLLVSFHFKLIIASIHLARNEKPRGSTSSVPACINQA